MLTKEECLKALRVMQYHLVRDPNLTNASIANGKFKRILKPRFQRKVDIIKQLIEEHFELQLTRSECDLIEFALKPLEEELGMDITLLIDKLRRIQNTLPKEEGAVVCVEID